MSLRDRRREQQRAALGGRGVEQALEVLAEAHVEHLVGLVEHDRVERGEHERAALEVIAQPARRADDDVHAVRRARALAARIHAADAGRDARAGLGVQPGQLAVDLQRELAGRRDDQRARRAAAVEALAPRRAAGARARGRTRRSCPSRSGRRPGGRGRRPRRRAPRPGPGSARRNCARRARGAGRDGSWKTARRAHPGAMHEGAGRVGRCRSCSSGALAPRRTTGGRRQSGRRPTRSRRASRRATTSWPPSCATTIWPPSPAAKPTGSASSASAMCTVCSAAVPTCSIATVPCGIDVAIAPSWPTATAVPSSSSRTSSNVDRRLDRSGDHVAPPSCDRIMPSPAAIASSTIGRDADRAHAGERRRTARACAVVRPQAAVIGQREHGLAFLRRCERTERGGAVGELVHVAPVSFVTRNVPVPATNRAGILVASARIGLRRHRLSRPRRAGIIGVRSKPALPTTHASPEYRHAMPRSSAAKPRS